MTRVTIVAVCLATLVAGTWASFRYWINPGVVHEIRTNPNGEQARKVMLLTLPSGKAIPVNYLREGATVYAAADFPWWRELEGDGGRGSVLIRGQTYHGHIRAVLDDPQRREEVFAKLRPSAPLFFGTMIEIRLER